MNRNDILIITLIEVGFSVFFLFVVPISAFKPLWFGILWNIFWSIILAYLLSIPFIVEKTCTCSHKCPDCGSEMVPV